MPGQEEVKRRVLIIGGGSIGERHLRCFQATGLANVSLCEPNAGLRTTLGDRYNVPVFANFDDALAAETFDATVICTPAHLHIPLARQSLSANLATLIEKPLSTSLDCIDDLRCQRDQTGGVVAVAYVLRFLPALRAAREFIRSGELGRPRQVVSVSGQHFPTFRPAYREIYYSRHSSGGGAIQDALTHQVNAVEWIIGPTTSLFCDAAHQVLEGVEVEDTVHVATRHGDVLGSFSLNQFQAPNESHLWIHCEKGSVKVEGHSARWGTLGHGQEEWQWHAAPIKHRDDLFVAQASAFLAAMDGRDPPACTLEEAWQTLIFNLAALESARSGQRIDL
jgi:predicted dehydrogenase